ncbi:hypothetical protein ABT373_39800 [Streptomyces sp. NPDC000070]|uniref:hypothetical protein n=1 Tax=Streptomyces sp. NPDC000070 TaxID=3154240 RepID=UPI00332E242C
MWGRRSGTRTQSTPPWSASPARPGIPKALAVRLSDGRVSLSQRLTTALASVVGPRLAPRPGRGFTKAGDSYTPAVEDVVVEVVAGTTRPAIVTVMRLR